MTTKPLTDNERIKSESDYLRGTLAQALADTSTGSIPADDQQLLKFLGATLQDNRDERLSRKKAGLERAYAFMVRLRLPGGRITPAQWLEMDRLADAYGNHTLKLTTRQSIQIHGIIKQNLQHTLRRIHTASLNAIASSGDATRNVMFSVHHSDDALHQEVQELAQSLSRELEPQTHAYHEIWLGEQRLYHPEEEEPLYGKTYLPRKFKIALTIPPCNDVDVYAQDLGFVAIARDQRIIGYNVLAGGGMGYAYGNKESAPRLADLVGFCRPEQALEVAKQVLLIHKDFSDRTDRKLSRLRYTIARRGIDWFREELFRRLGYALEPAPPFLLDSHADPQQQGDSRLHLYVEGGRVADHGEYKLKTALVEIARIHQGIFYITANQNIILAQIEASTKESILRILADHGISEHGSGLRLQSSACASLPYCPMSFTDSERYLPQLLTELESSLRQYGLWDQPITARMTGCPNGCTRPYVAELAFVGKGPGKYNIWLGGSPAGTRLGYIAREAVPAADIAPWLHGIFRDYSETRQEQEAFGDWAFRNKGHILTPA